MKWRQVVQQLINKIVLNYYLLPEREQTKLNILKLVDRYWENVNIKIFSSKLHYYNVLATTTDQLLQSLTTRKNNQPPLFLFEKINTYINELETQLSLTFDIVEWSTKTFTVKKYLLDADEEMIRLYNQLLVVFSKKAFGKIPESIEIITLVKGETYRYSPTVNDVEQGIQYLKYMKSLLLEPSEYIKTNSISECSECPFTEKCANNTSPNEDVLH
ncbi:hypothetical protein ACFSYB_04440 [Litchfieldia salsa]